MLTDLLLLEIKQVKIIRQVHNLLISEKVLVEVLLVQQEIIQLLEEKLTITQQVEVIMYQLVNRQCHWHQMRVVALRLEAML